MKKNRVKQESVQYSTKFKFYRYYTKYVSFGPIITF